MMKQLVSYWAGFLTSALMIYLFSYSGVSTPLGDGYERYSNEAPSDWIGEDAIYVTSNEVILNIKGASISRYAPTGSMKPLFDKGANGIRIQPQSVDDIEEGDIVSFAQEGTLIVHRVIEKGLDEEGTYFITKGDNNLITDGKIRFKDIRYITVGVIW